MKLENVIVADIVVSSLNLEARGKRLFKEMRSKYPDMDPVNLELLVEACRIVDQLEKLHDMMRGSVANWAFVKMPRGGGTIEIQIDQIASQRRQLQIALKQITATLTVAGESSGAGEDDTADELQKRRDARRAAVQLSRSNNPSGQPGAANPS